MPRDLSELAVGEKWAYRQKQTEPVACVEVTRLGTGMPPRVQVRFVGEEFEGRQDWVPPARLKVPWADVDEWRRNEQRWTSLREASGYIRGTAEDHAMWMVFDHLRELDLFAILHGADTGILVIHDIDALAADLDLDRAFLAGDPTSFVNDDGGLVIPWRVGRTVVERLARKHADKLLQEIEADEQKVRQRKQWGYYTASGTFIDPEICIETDQEFSPARELVREWCGVDAQDRYDELAALRIEVVRLGKLIERAISAVRAAGDTREADGLERELGIPLDVLRHTAGRNQGP